MLVTTQHTTCRIRICVEESVCSTDNTPWRRTSQTAQDRARPANIDDARSRKATDKRSTVDAWNLALCCLMQCCITHEHLHDFVLYFCGITHTVAHKRKTVQPQRTRLHWCRSLWCGVWPLRSTSTRSRRPECWIARSSEKCSANTRIL